MTDELVVRIAKALYVGRDDWDDLASSFRASLIGEADDMVRAHERTAEIDARLDKFNREVARHVNVAVEMLKDGGPMSYRAGFWTGYIEALESLESFMNETSTVREDT